MKHVAVLLCISGLAAVCLGQSATTANATATTSPAATSVPGATGSATSPSGSVTSSNAAASSNAATSGNAGGGGSTTDAVTGAATAIPTGAGATTVSCLNCTGDESDACGTATANSASIPKVDCDACWVYRDENTASGNVTIIRGCALGSDTCDADAQNEHCNAAGDITSCRRCCTTDDCNHNGLEVSGSGAADVHVSIAVTMASALFAILALRQ